MVNLQIRLLGQFQVNLKGEFVSCFVSDKVRALLAYLAVEGHVPQRRETLATLLWPDKTQTRARANLRGALTNLRKVIGDHKADQPYLLVTRQDIKVNPIACAWVDIDVLSRVHDLGKPGSENITQFDKILEIYKGEFLAGFNLPESLPFDEWALLKREQYARMMDDILQRVTNYYDSQGKYESALPFAWRHVELEPWQETARRQLMRLLVLTGKRDEAVEQYLDLAGGLQSALSINPGKKTETLYQRILAGENLSSVDMASTSENESAFLPDFLLKGEDRQLYPVETFVGRQDDLRVLHTWLDEMMAGRGSIVMLSGEAGSGKTALVREFIRQAQSRYPGLVSAAGYSNAFTGVGDPYLPFREILTQLSGDIETHWKAGSFSRQYAVNLWKTIPITCKSLLTYGPDLIDTILPGQALLESVDAYSEAKPSWLRTLEEHFHHKAQYPVNSVQQGSLFSQFVRVIQGISIQVPLLLFLDDLQWADMGSIGLLFQFVKQIKGRRIMLVGAYRSEEVGLMGADKRHPLIPILYEIQREFGDVLIHLGLNKGKDFIQALMLSEPNDLSESFREQLYLLTGGNALFTIELLRSLRESGVLARDGRGMWVLHSDLHLESLPPQTEGIIAQRISRLPQDLQRLLTIASIEGEVFTAEIAARVAGWSVNQVISMLSNKLDKQHRLVRPQQISQLGDLSISTYRFRHYLFQKYVYNRLDDIQRRGYHEQVGTHMESMAGENRTRYAVQLARHFHLANRHKKALTYYTMAGEWAVRMSAYTEAIGHYESAVSMLCALPEDPARYETELDLQLQLGLAYQATQGYANENVGKAYKRAWELCLSLGDTNKRINTIQLLISYYANIADFTTTENLLTILENDYTHLDRVPKQLALEMHLGYTYLDSIFGRHQAVSDRFQGAIKYYDQFVQYKASKWVGLDPRIFFHGWAGLHQNWLGYPEQAQAQISSILKLAESSHSNLYTKDALWFSAWISIELGNIDAARDYIEAMLTLCIKEHYFLYEGVARIFTGRLASWDGQHQEAIEHIQRGLDMYYKTGIKTFKPDWLFYLAEVYCAAGQIEDGLSAISKAEQIETETGEGRYKSALQRVKGDLFLLDGDESAAEDAYMHAIEIAQLERTKLFELEAVKHLANLWSRQGKAALAKRKLQDVYNWFTEGFDTTRLIQAKELLTELTK
jgi:adenylate cyclase